jgi:hypothetical protein
VCVQEGRELSDFEAVATRYQFFRAAGDEYTMVLVRHGTEVESFSGPVFAALRAAEPKAPADVAKAWRTTSSRVSVVRVKIGTARVTVASVHCSKHKCTADILGALKGIMERRAPADHFVIGCDTNVAGDEARDFQDRMESAGFSIGTPGDQVTVAKQRTMFQTQTLKCGEVDVSCKDYVFSWGAQFERVSTDYVPDLHSDFGVERGTEKPVRLPTTFWPFDHAGITVCFKQGKKPRFSHPWIRHVLYLLSYLLALLW